MLWEYYCYSEDGLATSGARRLFVEQELLRTAKALGLLFKSPQDIVNWYKSLHSEEILSYSGFPCSSSRLFTYLQRQVDSHPLFQYLTSHDVFINSKELVSVELAHEIDTLIALQDYLKKKLSEINATIEINPSSNLLIGHLADTRDHPLWNILTPTSSANKNLLVTIGSDDQLTFQTHVRYEYQLLDDCLRRMGVDDVAARSILKQIMDNGVQSRFTLPLDRHLHLSIETMSSCGLESIPATL